MRVKDASSFNELMSSELSLLDSFNGLAYAVHCTHVGEIAEGATYVADFEIDPEAIDFTSAQSFENVGLLGLWLKGMVSRECEVPNVLVNLNLKH